MRKLSLKPHRVLELDEKLVRVALPSIDELVHIVVVNHEQVAGGIEGPAQSRVGAERLEYGVVLQVAG